MPELFTITTHNINPKQATEKKYLEIKKRILDEIENTNEGKKIRSLGVIRDEKNLNTAIRIAYNLRKNFTSLYVFGMGGSVLAGKAMLGLKNYFGNKGIERRVEFIDYLDPIEISQKFSAIDEDTCFLFISKSGETSETISLYYALKTFLKDKTLFKNNCYFIVGEGQNSLREIAEKNHKKENIFVHESEIGGRFSFFSLVGLVPSGFMGFDVKKILEGANETIKSFALPNSQIHKAILTTLNSIDEINAYVFMPYIAGLKDFNLVLCQIWGESIGKDGFGIMPYPAIGAGDQHSQLQLYLDGQKNKLIEIIGVKNFGGNISIGKVKKPDFLNNKNLAQVLQAHLKGTISALVDKKQRVKHIELESLNEKTIGGLFAYYFLNIISSCYYLNLNPFNQPGVELIKKYAIKNLYEV